MVLPRSGAMIVRTPRFYPHDSAATMADVCITEVAISITAVPFTVLLSLEMVNGLNGPQDGDLSLRRQKARFDGVGSELAKLLLSELKLAFCKPIFARQIAAEERRIVRIQGNHEAGVEVAAHRMFEKRGAGTSPDI